MKSYILATFLVLTLFTPPALASDDGQTRPRITYGAVIFPNAAFDILNTNGTGNLKGIQCKHVNNVDATLTIFVDGGAGNSMTLNASSFPRDSDGQNVTGWIPFNVRFTSNIRVHLQKGNATGQVSCAISWALD